MGRENGFLALSWLWICEVFLVSIAGPLAAHAKLAFLELHHHAQPLALPHLPSLVLHLPAAGPQQFLVVPDGELI